MSSESMPPSNPKTAPEAPTETVAGSINRADSKFPPIPEIKYSNPTLTAK